MDYQGLELLKDAAERFRQYEARHRQNARFMSNQDLAAHEITLAEINKNAASKIDAYLAIRAS